MRSVGVVELQSWEFSVRGRGFCRAFVSYLVAEQQEVEGFKRIRRFSR